MWRGQCTSHTLLRSIKCSAWSLPVFSDSLLSPQGWGVQGSEQLCRWGSLHHIRGLKVGQTGWKDLLSVKLTLHFPSFFFPLPLLVRILTAEPICHHTHSYRMINIAGEIVLSAPRSFCKTTMFVATGMRNSHIRHASTRTQFKSWVKGALLYFHKWSSTPQDE